MNRRGNMVERVIADQNLEASFAYVMRGERRKKSPRGKYILKNKAKILAEIKNIVLSKSFKINGYHERYITERGKRRRIQCVSIETRILLNAVMRVVEEDLTPALITDTAASIKGRGMHWLHQRMYKDMMADKSGTAYTYISDYSKCYESIPQDKLIEVVKHYISDEWILQILTEAIRMLPDGVSIGLRTSQFLVNLYLSHYIDQRIKKHKAKYYRRYCDDIRNQTETAYKATGHIRLLHDAAKEAEMRIKPNEQLFRTDTRPVDFLGYVTYSNGKIQLRKATKQRFARKWKRVKSFKRKQELIGSFYGVAKHAHAKHLFKKLTGITMKQFSELGLRYERDGIPYHNVECLKLTELAGCKITVKQFYLDVPTQYGPKTLVIIDDEDGQEKKFFTGSDEMTQLLKQAKDKGLLPFETTIGRNKLENGKFKYSFK